MKGLSDWADWELQLGLPGGIWAAAVVLVLASIVLGMGLQELADVSRTRRRLLLGVLRLATVAAAALLVMQPHWVGQRMERVEGKLAILVDVSRSMSIQMAGQERRSVRAAKLLERWLDEAGAAPLLYGIGDGARLMSRKQLSGDAYPTNDDDTRIGAALRQVTDEQGEGLGAVIVLSDGSDLGDPAIRERVADLGVRVYSVLVGEDGEVHDDGIVAVRADPIAFLRQEAQVQVELRSTPARAGSVAVTLRRAGELVREVTAQLDDMGRATVTIPFPVTQLGRSVYTVAIPVGADDAVPENNERAFLVNATRDRLRVLLVCGRPSWDSRFLRSFLKSNPANDLITFFILRTPNDISMASQDELSLIPFPTDELFREHLDSFDLVIFQDFNFGPYDMARYLPRVREYVLGGGAFVMVGGDLSFGAGQYHNTPIADVLPVEMEPGKDALIEAPFRPVVAPDMGLHPVVSLLPHPTDNTAAWQALVEVPGMNRIRRLTDGAQALLVHPSERAADGKPMVVLAVGEPGRGRSLSLAIDGSWRWGMTTAGVSGDASAYERFWDRAVRWLSRDPLLDPNHIETDRPRYAPGATIRARVFLRDARYVPRAHQHIEVVVLDDDEQRLSSASADTDPQGRVEVVVTAPDELGGYRVAVRVSSEAEELSAAEPRPWVAEEGFVVEAGGDELADPRPNPEVLRSLAQATGGHFYTIDDAPALADLDRSRSQRIGVERVTPFATGWFFALFALLFAAEWAARRAWGLR